MDYTALIKQFRRRVLLGLPPSPFSYLMDCNRTDGRPHVFVDRCPLWLRLFPLATVHVSAAKAYSDTLLFELSDLAEQNAENDPDKDQGGKDARKHHGIGIHM